MKVITDATGYLDFNVNRGGAKFGRVSIWVSQSVFVGMTQCRFVGKFKMHDAIHKGRGRTSDQLDRYCKTLPCNIELHMRTSKNKAMAQVQLLDWGTIGKDSLGLVINGISKEVA